MGGHGPSYFFALCLYNLQTFVNLTHETKQTQMAGQACKSFGHSWIDSGHLDTVHAHGMGN